MTDSRAVEFKDLKLIVFGNLDYENVKEGRKTQTRRLIYPQPNLDLFDLGRVDFQSDERFVNSSALYWQPIVKFNTQRQYFACPFQINDVLMVLHPGLLIECDTLPDVFLQDSAVYDDVHKWLSKSQRNQKKIFETHRSFIQIRIENIRAHRLQQVANGNLNGEGKESFEHYQQHYVSIYGPTVWALNPWAWIYDFELVA